MTEKLSEVMEDEETCDVLIKKIEKSQNEGVFENGKEWELTDLSTRNVLETYINYKLMQEGYKWKEWKSLQPSKEVHFAIRSLCEDFNSSVFDEGFSSLEISSNTIDSTLQDLINHLFKERISWGRLCALFYITGKIVCECFKREQIELIPQISNVITVYIDTHLIMWVKHNGSWASLIDMYNEKCKRQKSNHRLNLWRWITSAGILSCIAVILIIKHK